MKIRNILIGVVGILLGLVFVWFFTFARIAAFCDLMMICRSNYEEPEDI